MGLYAKFTPGEVAAAGVVFPFIGAILVALRTRARLRKLKKLAIEDYLVYVALVLMIGMGIATVVGVATKSEGYSTPKEKGPKEATATSIEKVFWITELFQPLALGCIKLSFIFFYRKIFNVGPKTSIFNIVSIVSIVIMAVWMFGFFLAVLLICPGKIDRYWGPAAGRAQYCWPTAKFLYALCWSDVGTDLIILVMPIPSVLRLHITTRKKIGITCIFGIGILTVVASIIRAVFYVNLLNAEKTELVTFDPNMLNTNGIYWMLVETGLALIAVNLPLLYGTVRHEGIESVIRSVRSFASIRSLGSHSHSQHHDLSSAAASITKNSGEGLSENSIELVPQGTHSKSTSKALHNDVDVEAGNINVTKTYSVHELDPHAR